MDDSGHWARLPTRGNRIGEPFCLTLSAQGAEQREKLKHTVSSTVLLARGWVGVCALGSITLTALVSCPVNPAAAGHLLHACLSASLESQGS